jgi:hypothetical protein
MTKHVGFVPHSYLVRALESMAATVTPSNDVSSAPAASLQEEAPKIEIAKTNEVAIAVSVKPEVQSEFKDSGAPPDNHQKQQPQQQVDVVVLTQHSVEEPTPVPVKVAASKEETSSDSDSDSPPIKRSARVLSSVIAPPTFPLSLREMPVCCLKYALFVLVRFSYGSAPRRLLLNFRANGRHMRSHSRLIALAF